MAVYTETRYCVRVAGANGQLSGGLNITPSLDGCLVIETRSPDGPSQRFYLHPAEAEDLISAIRMTLGDGGP